jgi:hypothetical protein
MKSYKIYPFIVLFSVLSACKSAEMEAPAGFAIYKEQSQFRATSPDGVALRIRTVKNEPEGSMEVIASAIEIQFKTTGYTISEKGSVKSKEGWDGRYYITSVQTMAGDYRYLVAIFLQDKKIHLVEAGGRKEEFEPYRKEILEKLGTLH